MQNTSTKGSIRPFIIFTGDTRSLSGRLDANSYQQLAERLKTYNEFFDFPEDLSWLTLAKRAWLGQIVSFYDSVLVPLGSIPAFQIHKSGRRFEEVEPDVYTVEDFKASIQRDEELAAQGIYWSLRINPDYLNPVTKVKQ